MYDGRGKMWGNDNDNENENRWECNNEWYKDVIENKRKIQDMTKDLTTTTGIMQNDDSEYVRLVSLISGVWDKAKENAALAVNTELLDASWATGRYIVEYEQHGNVKAEYGKQLLTNLSRDPSCRMSVWCCGGFAIQRN